jgi:membrane fusion protein (multidrug efflux system)
LAYAADWWLYGRFWVVTVLLSPAILSPCMTTQRQYVRRDDLLVRLDAQRAAAALGQAEGELGRAVRAVGALFATRFLSRTALLDKIRHDIIRYRQALPSGSVSRQVLQNAENQKASLEADLKEARAELQSAEARVRE